MMTSTVKFREGKFISMPELFIELFGDKVYTTLIEEACYQTNREAQAQKFIGISAWQDRRDEILFELCLDYYHIHVLKL